MRNDPEKLRREINEYIKKNIVKYFRFHSSGAVESVKQLKLYADICRDNPEVVFYIYTKEFDYFAEYICSGEQIPDNLIVNLSEWHGNVEDFLCAYSLMHTQEETEIVRSVFSSFNVFIYDDHTTDLKNETHCPAVDKKGHETGITCAQCRRCMHKGNITAVYAH